MNAIPMIQRCGKRQWRGLSSEMRAYLTAEWKNGNILGADNAIQKMFPIWWTTAPNGQSINLMSVKEDF